MLAALALVLATLMTTPLSGQRPGAEAEAVMASLLERLDARDWRGVAELMDPDVLERFRDEQLGSVRAMERHRAEPHSAGPMDAPPEVQAWFEAQRKKYEATMPVGIPAQFAGVQTLEELEALTPAELFARWLEANDPREQVERAFAAHGVERPVVRREAGWLAERRTVLGSVLEDDSTADVLFAAAPADPRAPAVFERRGVATFRRTPAGWRFAGSWGESGILPQSFNFSLMTSEDAEPELQRAAERVVSWPPGAVPAGNARIEGYPGGGKPPRGLLVESRAADGTVTRTTIPPTAFGELLEILTYFAGSSDPPAEPPR